MSRVQVPSLTLSLQPVTSTKSPAEAVSGGRPRHQFRGEHHMARLHPAGDGRTPVGDLGQQKIDHGAPHLLDGLAHTGERRVQMADRKSTRLNSSHVKISYA